ncbi:39S ribosomal protein L16, mitochondrial [Savitreella phatthalungensis]
MLRAAVDLFRPSAGVSSVRHASHQYAPRRVVHRKPHKGKVPIPIGGSTKGSTVSIGDFGLRLKDSGQRLSAKQLQGTEAVIRRIIKAEKGARAFLRPVCDLAVCRKGNETRMGKGKGDFDHWATRVSIGKIVWEIQGASEEIAKEAFRQAAMKLPGKYEFVRKGDPPVVGRHRVELAATEAVIVEDGAADAHGQVKIELVR